MNFSGNVGSSPRISAPERAAQAGQPRADREGQREDAVDVQAEPRRDARVVHRGAQPAAEAGARQHPLQQDGERGADRDDEQAVLADADAFDVEAALQPGRQLQVLLLRAQQESPPPRWP